MKAATVIIFTIFLNDTYSRKLLAVPFPWRSHYKQMELMLLELVRRGHEVLVVIPKSESYAHGITFKKILFDTGDLDVDTLQTNAERRLYNDETYKLVWLREFLCTQAYIVQQMMKSPDVVAAAKNSDFLFTDASYMPVVALADYFDLPFMVLSPWGFTTGIQSDLYGIQDNPAVYPAFLLAPFLEAPSTSNQMGVTERILSHYAYIICHGLRHVMTTMCMSSLQETYTKNGIVSKWTDVQLVLVPCDFAVEFPLPLPPVVKVIGPLTVGPSKSLAGEYEEILSNSNDGVIIVSFGGTSSLKKSVIRNLLAALLSLKQTIIWKFRREEILKAIECPQILDTCIKVGSNCTNSICNLRINAQKDDVSPSFFLYADGQNITETKVRDHARFGNNVYVFDWIPQNDLLGNSKVIAFVSHCGTNGMYESIYHRVPMICMPLFGDHWQNAGRVTSRNLGLSLHYSQVNEDVLQEAVSAVTSSFTIRESLNETSKLIRARKQGSIEYGVDLMELHMRYGNSLFLRPNEGDFSYGRFGDFVFYGPHFILVLMLLLKLYLLIVRSLLRVDS